MIRFIRNILCIAGLLATSLTGVAQDVMYSQAYAAPMLISPSFAGLSYGSRLSTNFRDQWPGSQSTYRNYAVSWDAFFDQYNSGVGVMVNRNDQGHGIYVHQIVSLLYAYDIEVARGYYIRPGMQFQYIDRALDYSKLMFGNTMNPLSGAGSYSSELGLQHNSKFDVAASVMGYNKWAWFGLSVDHLVKSKIGFTDMGNYNNIKTTVYGGTKFELHKILSGQTQQTLSFAFQYLNQGGFNQLELGSYWFLNPLEIGLWYRGIPIDKVGEYVNNDAVIFIAGVTLGSIKFAYSYDLTISNLAGYSGGANEISVIWTINNNFTIKSRHGAIPCPGANQGNLTPGRTKYSHRSSGGF